MDDREGWREGSGISVLIAQHDDDDDDDIIHPYNDYYDYILILSIYANVRQSLTKTLFNHVECNKLFVFQPFRYRPYKYFFSIRQRSQISIQIYNSLSFHVVGSVPVKF